MTGGGAGGADEPTIGRGRDPRPSASSVAAVIVTYHPDAGLADRVRPLIGQVGATIIIDNGSSDTELAPVDSLVREGVVEAIRNGRNRGLATALNQGLAWTEERGYAWALTLDQDTRPTSAVVHEAARVFAEHADGRVAVIGAGYRARRAAVSSPNGGEVAHVITAGALYSVSAWQRLGGFQDDFFIDYVDIEFCLRARAGGYRVVQASVPTITHAIGRPTSRRLLFRSFSPSNHDRKRRYFITRNRIVVWRRYWRRERRWVASDAIAAVKELAKIVFFEADRRGKLRAIARGARDGMGARSAKDGPLVP